MVRGYRSPQTYTCNITNGILYFEFGPRFGTAGELQTFEQFHGQGYVISRVNDYDDQWIIRMVRTILVTT